MDTRLVASQTKVSLTYMLSVRPTVVALWLALTVLLGGCAWSGAQAPVPAGATRTVTDAEGTEITVPVDPQRIVTLSEPTLDGVLALGLRPIGTVSGRGQAGVPGYLAAEAADLSILGGIAEPNFEAIGQAKPDLIVVDGTSVNNNPPVIEALRAIAPTAFVGYAGGDWRDTFATLADVLNQQERGKQVLAAYDARVKDVKKRLAPYADDTFSIVRWQGSSAALILNELPPGRALLDLGLRRPKNQDRDGRGHSEPVSRENLTEIDADWMFFGTLGGASVDNPGAAGGTDSEAAQRALAEAEKAPGFTSLKAFRDDHIILVDGSRWTSTGGPLLMGKIVEDVQRSLVEEQR